MVNRKWKRIFIINLLATLIVFSFRSCAGRQAAFLVKERHIYVLSDGRINMCGVTTKNVDYVAASIREAVTTITD